ncbi:MAG: hypothetical protein H6719_10195 [Sandaracinaceae bacterium]|nr:hypothetical protein [Sandaracinaceae bacterium]
MRSWCHPVPLAAALSLLPGCFLFHGFGDPPSAGPDAGPDLPPIADAGSRPPPPRVDAGPATPPPTACTTLDMTIACTDTGNGAVPVGVPYDLPIALGGPEDCFCGEQIDCEARIVGPHQIALDSFLCIPPLLCDGCFPFVAGSCRLPPLEEGTWHALVNGRDAFDLRVTDASPVVGPVDACVTLPGDASPCDPLWIPQPELVDQICLPAIAPPGTPIHVAVTDFCLHCGDEIGSCEVVRTANDVRIVPTSLPPSCDIDCIVECSQFESTCVIPPLEPGAYTVHVDGLPGTLPLRIEEGSGPGPATSCLSIPED